MLKDHAISLIVSFFSLNTRGALCRMGFWDAKRKSIWAFFRGVEAGRCDVEDFNK